MSLVVTKEVQGWLFTNKECEGCCFREVLDGHKRGPGMLFTNMECEGCCFTEALSGYKRSAVFGNGFICLHGTQSLLFHKRLKWS